MFPVQPRSPHQLHMTVRSTVLWSALLQVLATFTLRQEARQEAAQEAAHLGLDNQIPDGFDPRTAEQQEDGQLCVFKKLSLEGLQCVQCKSLCKV